MVITIVPHPKNRIVIENENKSVANEESEGVCVCECFFLLPHLHDKLYSWAVAVAVLAVAAAASIVWQTRGKKRQIVVDTRIYTGVSAAGRFMVLMVALLFRSLLSKRLAHWLTVWRPLLTFVYFFYWWQSFLFILCFVFWGFFLLCHGVVSSPSPYPF